MKALGLVIREHRTRLGLSQKQFAHLAELDRSYVGELERGDRNPTIQVLQRISTVLDLRASELLRLSEEVAENGSLHPACGLDMQTNALHTRSGEHAPGTLPRVPHSLIGWPSLQSREYR